MLHGFRARKGVGGAHAQQSGGGSRRCAGPGSSGPRCWAPTFRRQLAGDRVRPNAFFIPFYFFSAGLQLRTEDLALQAVLVGGGFLATMIPLRVALVAVHRRMALGETLQVGTRIGVAMLPTLEFTLVIAEILRDAFAVPEAVFGGLAHPEPPWS